MKTLFFFVMIALGASTVYAAATVTLDFEAFELGKTPAGFSTALTGGGGSVSWIIQEDRTAPGGGKVLAQILPNVGLVGEVNGESGEGERADNSGLLGVIWQPVSSKLLVDLGLKRGISSAASDWQLTTGLTFAFSLPSP